MPRTSCRCPTRGSTPGSRPGTWRSTRSPSPTSTRRSRSTSCWCCCREWFQHPAARCRPTSGTSTTSTRRSTRGRRSRCGQIDGGRDHEFLERIFHKLLMNFTWWLNREDAEGDDLFAGGFLGLDNLSAFDRSHLPVGGSLEQSDATAWMYAYCLSMLRMARDPRGARPRLRRPDARRSSSTPSGSRAPSTAAACGTTRTASSTTRCACPTAPTVPLKVHSMVGLLPMLPAVIVPETSDRNGAWRSASISPGSSRTSRLTADAGARAGSSSARPASAG